MGNSEKSMLVVPSQEEGEEKTGGESVYERWGKLASEDHKMLPVHVQYNPVES